MRQHSTHAYARRARNYRLPKEIAAFAQELGGKNNLAAHCKSPYHEKPVLKCVSSAEAAMDYMVERIRNLDLQDVAVVVPTNEDSKKIFEVLSRQLGANVVSASWDINHNATRVKGVDFAHLRDTRVKIMTYEKVKGQQFETVFLSVQGEMNAEQIKRFYVGVTRAERFLYVLYTDPMPACLRQVPVELYNTTDETVNFEGLYRPEAKRSEDIVGAVVEDLDEEVDW